LVALITDIFDGHLARTYDLVTDFGSYDEHGPLIDDVVSRVLTAFQESATGEDQLELQAARPSIPPDIDRALLRDACDVTQKYDLDEKIRYRLRARFWTKYDHSCATPRS
ncbi:CDP-alcohol phosphatidyltransferase family protein, partial [Streptomyces sp. NPDC096934]|uniref:CDP-alcohol phosphatidyltransferase family protein n=1 Tax=Streptomyces sp. NPDC096934 TaxID=3155551 RepID=UPI003320D0C5